MTSYVVLYEKCLAKIEDPSLVMLPEEDLENLLHGWMTSAIAKHRKCTNDLSNRDDELRQFNVDLTDIEQEILAIMMTREWVSQQLHSVTLTSQVFSGKEAKFYSQSSHIAELRELDERLKIEAQKLSRDYTYVVSEYFND